jgi:MinD superfamily P-loop ATPase
VRSRHGADSHRADSLGLHDLRQAAEVARGELVLPVCVVISADGIVDRGVGAHCADEDISTRARISLDRRLAEACSGRIPLVEAYPTYRGRFVLLWKRLEELVCGSGGKADERHKRHPSDG